MRKLLLQGITNTKLLIPKTKHYHIFFINLLFVIGYLLLGIPAAFAAGEFETSYQVRYSINDVGKATVNQNITLKNKTTNYYADKFELKIGSTKVEDVKAADAAGSLQTEVKFENNVTTISVKFNQKVIGIDKTLPWTLSYTSNELASRSGQIWEVSIPRLAKSQEIASYTATVATPVSFGPVAFAVPEPNTSTKLVSIQEFTFTKDQLENSGIAMSFGIKQVFSFTLNYYLENNGLTTRSDEITLPPDNNYQKVVLTKIEPQPLNITVDDDNNFLAKYRLNSKQSLNIKAEGYIEVFSKPFRNVYSQLTDSQRQKYLENNKYWEIDNAFIKSKAQELKTPENIYKFVSDFLSYSEERLKLPKVERKGAAAAVLTPKDAVCMEFTDLFIAVARAAGIPAREVEGYAYTQNERLRPLSLSLESGDILHAWPEYWDDKLGWIQVDPTWGSTSGGLDFFNKLDFNHITFIQRGTSSTFPFPAGSYKKDSSRNEKDIFIDFAVELPNVTSTPSLDLAAPSKILAGIPVKITATVQNVGNTSIINQTLKVTTTKLKRAGQLQNPIAAGNEYESTEKINTLPPFAKVDYEFNLQGNGVFEKQTDVLTLSYYDSQIAIPIEIIPIYSLVFLRGFLISSLVAISIITTGLLLYKKTHNKKPRPVF